MIKSIKTTSARYRSTGLMDSCRRAVPTRWFPPPTLTPPAAKLALRLTLGGRLLLRRCSPPAPLLLSPVPLLLGGTFWITGRVRQRNRREAGPTPVSVVSETKELKVRMMPADITAVIDEWKLLAGGGGGVSGVRALLLKDGAAVNKWSCVKSL